MNVDGKDSKMRTDKGERVAYHHGDLPRVLLAKAIELLDERGVEGFSLREVARRAKVAAAAPSHHFGNVSGLLTAVATEGFRQLVADFKDVLDQDLEPIDQVIGMCEAYVNHHRRYPGTVSVMFRHELLDNDNAELLEVGSQSLDLLKDAVGRAILEDAAAEKVDWVAKILWATMHGLVMLQMDESETLSARVAFAARSVIAGSDAQI